MPLAHICPLCGSQLARLRAAPDPVYGLPIVICPCGHPSVRRRHPMVRHYRRAAAAARAALLLILHFLLLALLSLGTAGFTSAIQRSLKDLRLSPGEFVVALASGRSKVVQSWIDDDAGLIVLLGFVLVSFIVGIWLRAGLAHWRWPTPILGWAAAVSFWTWFEAVVWPLTWLNGRLAGQPAKYSGPGPADSIHLLQILAVSLLISFAAAPVGRAISRTLAWSRGKRFIKNLNKRRKARRGE